MPYAYKKKPADSRSPEWVAFRRAAVNDFLQFMQERPDLSRTKAVKLFVPAYREKTGKQLSEGVLHRLMEARSKGADVLEDLLTHRRWGGDRRRRE